MLMGEGCNPWPFGVQMWPGSCALCCEGLHLPSRLSEVKTAKEQAETRLGDCKEQLLAMHQELDHLHKGSGASPDGEALYKVR